VGENPWGAGTLEWLPSGLYATRSIPLIEGREPLWDRPQLAREVEDGAHFLPGALTGVRETIVTSAVDARPQHLMKLPGPSWWPVVAAAGTACFFILLTVKLVWVAVAGAVTALAAILIWLWELDPGPYHRPVDIGFGVTVPVTTQGKDSHSWWAMVVLLMAGGTTFASLAFGYLFLWTSNPGAFPPPEAPVPSPLVGLAAAVLYAASGVVLWLAFRFARQGANGLLSVTLLVSLLLVVAAYAADLGAPLLAGLEAPASAYGAIVYAILSYQGLHIALILVMAGYVAARVIARKVALNRLVTVENVTLFWSYTVGQGLLGLFIVHLLPRLLGR
jgi:cytochrome c oxidase subunit I+III